MSEKPRSKQETLLLEERIEKIRKKNEEIKRRHLEVEADKQNAAKLNALVQITSPSEDWPVGGRSSPPPPPRSQGTNWQKRSELYKSQQNNNRSGSSGKTFIFPEGDGPPPDPKYKFLADSERDSENNYFGKRQSRPHRGRGISRGAPRDRQHRVAQNPHRETEHHPEYEAWRAERIRIDNDRISRQKTAEGQWRREWDHEKITQEEDVRLPTRGSKSSGPRRSNNWVSFTQHTNQDYMSNKSVESFDSHTPGRGRRGLGSGSPKLGRGNSRGHRVVAPFTDNEDRKEEKTELHGDRNVTSVGESIKVSVSNNSTPVLKRVKVNAPIVGGTGRVGPRQRIRVSYSSQSEDEAPHSRIVQIQSSGVDSDAPNHLVSTASSKPPLPPSGHKAEAPRPKRQRAKRTEQRQRGERRDSNDTDKNDESEKGNESGGDDSWEDVTTTSGNESTCEEMSPLSKSYVDNNDSINPDVNQVKEINESLTIDKDSNEVSVSEEIITDELESGIQKEIKSDMIISNSEGAEVNPNVAQESGPANETIQSTALENKAELEESAVRSDSFEQKPITAEVQEGC